ncbi:hypothetical protein V499_02994 [Pseudogymnoascus sp. VKM F-103]|nr:hypothetical protein V499_02994 [Pseudogymnoascus sp. VKM F-103]
MAQDSFEEPNPSRRHSSAERIVDGKAGCANKLGVIRPAQDPARHILSSDLNGASQAPEDSRSRGVSGDYELPVLPRLTERERLESPSVATMTATEPPSDNDYGLFAGADSETELEMEEEDSDAGDAGDENTATIVFPNIPSIPYLIISIHVGSSSKALDIVPRNFDTYRTGEWQILEVLLTSSGHSTALSETAVTAVPTSNNSSTIAFSAGQSKVYIDDMFVAGQ